MQNPWESLPKRAPYVLQSDAPALNAFNKVAGPDHQFDTSLLPEPFFGSLDAPVVVLNLNPGRSTDDAKTHARPAFAAMARCSLTHELTPYPFLHLQPNGDWPGAQWWHQRVRELCDDVGYERVIRNLACIQFSPYHSEKYSTASPRLPSQTYSFHLVRRAIARKAEIVILRSVRLWFGAVPELKDYAHLHRGANPRAPYLSRGNLKHSYPTIARRLRK